MRPPERTGEEIAELADLMRARLGVRGPTLRAVLARARHRLPRRIRARAARLAEAEPLARHPKLRLTLDHAALARAAAELRGHLDAMDLAERRRGWWLGVLGGLAFNMLLLAGLLLALLRWRGFV